MSPRLYLCFLSCFITIIIFIEENDCVIFRKNENYDNRRQIEFNFFKDFPGINDILQYLQSLKMAVEFTDEHKSEIDINFAFALSIANDNFEHILMKTESQLSSNLKTYINNLLKYNNELLQYFEAMVKLSLRDEKHNTHSEISTLFLNRTLGAKGIKDFYKEKMTPLYLNKSSYPRWEMYVTKVSQYDKWKPSPKESDSCLASLAKNKMNRRVCEMSFPCYAILVSGTNFGYSLTHRLLILLQAHRGRGCNIFSPREDQELQDMFCTKIFREANYIAANQYKILDLMLEQMTLCSSAGYADTLRRSWLSEVLRHQTPFGCFTTTLPVPMTLEEKAKVTAHPWKIFSTGTAMLGGACDRHLTAVAISALSSAVRYVLEKSY